MEPGELYAEHLLEQATKAMDQTAGMVAAYHRSLLAAGLPDDLARELVLAYHEHFMSHVMFRPEPPAP